MTDRDSRRPLPPSARLIEELDAAARAPARDLVQLQEAICEYTHAMRADGYSVDRVLDAVKQLALGRNLHASGREHGDHLVESIVKYCLVAYQDVS